ncbi:MAG: hypothetical protein IH840_10280 [Candidatus Heimdallarchaeota archaeon]|nr:hypothetical protein [Candidatus Heimdallarchaeota archaeon]
MYINTILTRRKITAILIPLVGFIALGSIFYIIFDIILGIGGPDGADRPDVFILVPVFLFGVGTFSGLLAFYYYYPEIRNRPNVDELKDNPTILDVVKYISNGDEVQIIDAIRQLDKGAYQFEITSLTDLSRMKVHRVIKRLVDRDILFKEGNGRNSKIYVSEWIQQIGVN